MRRKSRLAVLLLLLAALAAGCESLALAPVGKMPTGFQPEPDEKRLWNRSLEEQRRLDRSGHLYDDRDLEAYVNEVLPRLVPPEVTQHGFGITVRVLKNPLLNAFTYPNGVIYLHTGILARMDNEAQLATLLGHELIHATHRHGVRQFRDILNKTAFASTLGALGAPFGAAGGLVGLIGAVGAVAAVYGFSQEQEREADQEGLALMVRAGYDPGEAPKLFGHLKQWVEEEKKKEPFFFGTHPRLTERIESFEQLLAGEYKEAAARGGRLGVEEFLARTRRLVLDNALLDLQAGRFVQARKGLTKYLASADDSRAHYYLGETYRRENEPKERPQAIQHYQKAIDLDSAFADPHRGLGTLYYQEGKREEARQAFERYLILAPVAKDRPFIEGILKELADGERKP